MEHSDTTIIAAQLGRVPLFSAVAPGGLVQLAKAVRTQEFAPNTTILQQDSSDLGLFVIRTGQVRVVREEGSSHVVLATLSAGEFFGEMGLLDGGPRSATITAITATTCWLLDAGALLDAIQHNPDIAVAMLGVLSRRIRQMVHQLAAD